MIGKFIMYSLCNIKVIKTVILKILKTQMAKGTKLSFHLKVKLQFVNGWQKAADYVKMLNDLSLVQKRVLSMWRRMDFPAR